MKIEKISEDKIKVTLTLDDLQERNIDLGALSHNSPQAQQLFLDMMELAREEHGFFIEESQIFIEAIPTPPEGFEIIVSKIDENEEFESFQKIIKNKLKRSDLSAKRKSRKLNSGIAVYSFANFDDLCTAVKYMSPYYKGDSSLYKYDRSYYLTMSKNYSANSKFKNYEIPLNEYGQKVAGNLLVDGFLSEHGEKLIEENAIEVIMNYF